MGHRFQLGKVGWGDTAADPIGDIAAAATAERAADRLQSVVFLDEDHEFEQVLALARSPLPPDPEEDDPCST